MKETGVIMQGASVRAILADRKTQTRRPIKPQPGVTEKDAAPLRAIGDVRTLDQIVTAAWREGFVKVPCRYGDIGDRLWVREALRIDPDLKRWVYTADTGEIDIDPEREPERHEAFVDWALEARERPGDMVPSIYMPRWASRITLEIADVRVERLLSISEEDAIAEGVRKVIPSEELEFDTALYFPPDDDEPHVEFATAQNAFLFAWDGIHGRRENHETNPWVWCLTFRRCA